MSTDIKLSKSQLAKIIQPGGFLGKTSGNLGKKVLIDLTVTLAKDVLPQLASKATSFLLDKFDRKISGQGPVRARKGFALFISNEDMDDIIKIVESIKKSSLLIDGATETVKNSTKKLDGGFFRAMTTPLAASLITPMTSSLTQPVVCSLINSITG